MRLAVAWFGVFAALTGGALAASEAGLEWTVVEGDCNYVVQHHERAAEVRRGGAPVETIVLRAGAGTYAYAECSVPAARAVDDLVAGVWIKSDRSGLQLLGRIVLPRTTDPRTNQPYRVLVPGESYQTPGLWQRVALSALPRELQRQTRVLRAKTPQPIDPRGAYLESLVLNVFGGPGSTQVWIDAIELDGRVEPEAELLAAPSGSGPTDGGVLPLTADDRPQIRVDTLQAEGRPFFPRVIEHRGESFELCQKLGFNAICLATAPTEQQLAESRRLGLWLLCPPPHDVDQVGGKDARILAWFCGMDLPPDPQLARRLDEIRRNDPCARPLVAGTTSHQWATSRQVDILLRNRAPLGTSFDLAGLGPWLQDMTQMVRPGTPFWSTVQTELPRGVLRQAEGLLARPPDLPSYVEGEQMRQMALAALAAGARGLWFCSDHPLDAADPATQLRRLLLERLNQELLLVAAWAMGGRRVGEVAAQNPQYRVTALATERSRLLIPCRVLPHAQFVCIPGSDGNSLVVSGAPDSSEIFLLTPVGLQSVRHQRITGGLRLETDRIDSDALILMTQDPLVVAHVDRITTEVRDRAAELECEIANRLLQTVQQRCASVDPQGAQLASDLAEAESSLQSARELLQSNDAVPAYRFARQSQLALSRIRAALWQADIQPYGSPLAHPGGAAFELCGALRQHALSLTEGDWSDNLLAGGDCEQLPQMLAMGWRQHQVTAPGVQTYLALSPEQAREGRQSLRLRVEALSDEARYCVAESPAVRIHTAPVTVQPGQLVRIIGWIRIEQPLQGNRDGCLIWDSLGGPDLALRWYQTDGWQPFQMLRYVDQADHLTVTFALAGVGEVWLDEIRVCTRAAEARLAARHKPSPLRRN